MDNHCILRMSKNDTKNISKKKVEGLTLLAQLHDEFGEDKDGYELRQYLEGHAKDRTPAEIKRELKFIRDMKFSDKERPEIWAYRCQMLLAKWKRLPAGRRGGTISDLSDMLLDKVPESCRTYVEYLRAFTATNKKLMGDFQMVAKLLVEQHKEHYKGREPALANFLMGPGCEG